MTVDQRQTQIIDTFVHRFDDLMQTDERAQEMSAQVWDEVSEAVGYSHSLTFLNAASQFQSAFLELQDALSKAAHYQALITEEVPEERLEAALSALNETPVIRAACRHVAAHGVERVPLPDVVQHLLYRMVIVCTGIHAYQAAFTFSALDCSMPQYVPSTTRKRRIEEIAGEWEQSNPAIKQHLEAIALDGVVTETLITHLHDADLRIYLQRLRKARSSRYHTILERVHGLATKDYERFHQELKNWIVRLARQGAAIDLASAHGMTPETWSGQREMYRKALWRTDSGAAWKLTHDSGDSDNFNQLDAFLEEAREQVTDGMLYLLAGLKVVDATESSMGIVPALHEIADNQRHELPATSNKAREHFWAVFDVLDYKTNWGSLVEIFRAAAKEKGIKGPKAQNKHADTMRKAFARNEWRTSSESVADMIDRVKKLGSEYDG